MARFALDCTGLTVLDVGRPPAASRAACSTAAPDTSTRSTWGTASFTRCARTAA